MEYTSDREVPCDHAVHFGDETDMRKCVRTGSTDEDIVCKEMCRNRKY